MKIWDAKDVTYATDYLKGKKNPRKNQKRSDKMVSKIKFGIFVNILSAISFLVSVVSAIGTQFSRRGWTQIHTISSWIFVFLVVVHIILHWNWFKNLFKMIK